MDIEQVIPEAMDEIEPELTEQKENMRNLIVETHYLTLVTGDPDYWKTI